MVLGPTLENEFRTAMALSDGHYSIFYTSPVAMGFFALAALIIALQTASGLRLRKTTKLTEKSNA